ncbi:MAG: hypothetical protein VYE81_04590 [Planctomycetota bacterium]|nr:hypothetical protein [Planctomycetota bacterium]
MRKFVWFLVLVLALAHWDFWFWDDRSLVAGFLPVGLAYHAAFSLAAGVVWALVVKFAWPVGVEHWASEGDEDSEGAERE